MNIKCPQCVETKQLSITRIEKQDKNIERPDIFWDEAGDKHVHSSNWNKEYYRCSNGHTWATVYYPARCPVCGWNYKEADP